MKNIIISLVAGLCFSGMTMAQKATISEQKISMPTYMFSDPDPVPDMDKNYPYFRFDGYTNTKTQQEWNMVIMENEYIRVFITPEIGGKIWGAIEKSTQGEFLYYNDAVKFRDVGHRGPWTSGGLEYNFGLMSHVSTCSTPQDYVIRENDDGSVSCIIGAIDLHTRTKWNVEVNLPRDKAYVETMAYWFNSNSVPVTYYHYMNAAAKTEGNLEFIYPGSHHVGHGGEVGDWPVDEGREISYYEKNNFGPYKSYHVLNAYSDFMGGYWHDDDFGFGHLGNYDDRPGKKLWIWGLSQQGEIWVDLLTDSKGQYIEFQSGKLFNQAMEKSSLTPFKHREFIPYDADVMSEIWFPIKGTGGMVAASKNAVLNASRAGDDVDLRLSALQNINSKLVIKSGGKMISEEMIELDPLELYESTARINSNDNFTVELGDDLLFYSSDKEDMIVNRPIEPNTDFNWDSAIGLYTKGLELEKQQSYIDGHAYSLAHDLYIRSLELDPAFAPALNRLALSFYRRMDYEKALEYILRSMAIDTYDPEANYYFGLINLKLNKITDAKSGFSIATQSTTYRAASYTELAKQFLKEKKYAKSAEYSRKALAFNKYNAVALEILAIVSRKTKNPEAVNKALTSLHEFDNTSAFVVYERILQGQADISSLRKLITNELPTESYLRLAIKYFNYILLEESIAVLKAAPKNATVYFWLAFLDIEHSEEWLSQGLEASPEFVFPYRDETFSVLNHLMTLSDDWKLKYYSSLIYWKKGLISDAKELFEQCGDEPDYAPFYLAKAKLFKDESATYKGAIEKAVSLDKADWRANLALINLYMDEMQFEQAAKISKKMLADHPEMALLGIGYADALLKSGQYEKCLKFLRTFEVLPYEGANEGRNIYHETCIRNAFREMKKENYDKAMKYAEEAKQWPVNLGAGKPYSVDERLDDFIIGYCYKKMGKRSDANTSFTKVVEYSRSDQRRPGASLYLQLASLKELDQNKEAEDLIKNAALEYPDNIYVKWIQALEKGEAQPITKEIMSEDQNAPSNNSFLLVNELINIID